MKRTGIGVRPTPTAHDTSDQRPGAARPAAQPAGRVPRLLHAGLVVGLLLLCGILACTALVTDSLTFDEVAHLPAGLSYLKTGDFRLSPEHPPLFKMWCAWPLLFMDVKWPAPDEPSWVNPDPFGFGQILLCKLNNGQKLAEVGRIMMVLVLLGTALAVYALARTLFGPGAGLLSLALAALHPSLLAHGHLVATDLPITFCAALVLLAFAALLRRTTWPRVLGAGIALAAAAQAKLSWPLLLPAVAVMLVAALARKPTGAPTASVPGMPRARRALIWLGCCVLIALLTWAGIWTGYGWKNTRIAPLLPTGTAATRVAWTENVGYMARSWHEAFYDSDGQPRSGVLPGLLRFAMDRHLLPEPYIYGLAIAQHSSQHRNAYFCGEISNRGWRLYFPLTFAIKTPIPILLLLAAGLTALAARRIRIQDPVLLSGCLAFIVVYAGYAILGSINIGERHLLPVYPLLLALAGAAAGWLRPAARVKVNRAPETGPTRRDPGGNGVRVAVCLALAAALAWLLVANLRIRPHYLAYFNEAVGGPRQGYKYLVDSSMDWGQDLLRLGDYARQHPREQLKICYFGAAVPRAYLPCETLPSFFDSQPRAAVTAGTYVVSFTQLVGLYDEGMRESYWTDAARKAYADRARAIADPPPANAAPDIQAKYQQACAKHADWRARRLIAQLKHRRPDDAIGYTLLVYRLGATEVEQLTAP